MTTLIDTPFGPVDVDSKAVADVETVLTELEVRIMLLTPKNNLRRKSADPTSSYDPLLRESAVLRVIREMRAKG
jgi:hypothetical protein